MANWSKRTQEILVSEDFYIRVADLATEAFKARDHERIRLCEIALGCGVDGAKATDRERADARDECARILAAAEVRAVYDEAMARS